MKSIYVLLFLIQFVSCASDKTENVTRVSTVSRKHFVKPVAWRLKAVDVKFPLKISEINFENAVETLIPEKVSKVISDELKILCCIGCGEPPNVYEESNIRILRLREKHIPTLYVVFLESCLSTAHVVRVFFFDERHEKIIENSCNLALFKEIVGDTLLSLA